ncbi:Coq4 family protein [Sphingomonas montanisoli]|uniref:Ubiquinone biosynthesis protein n=1 Tax=Sphingomonas montanisoli TaxID=2606412 RepID=A0A5D9CB44_9SPHN|nr:Coq4 family protein [Sphingomonas montanisoli]TZG28954.1 hypothetical protein FYJ91_02075 [Sphingomonas montanisoli]
MTPPEVATLDRERIEDPSTIADANERRALTDAEKRYMRGEAEPAVSSVLTSNSKYLNDPYFRETFAQFALRRHGPDLPETYLIPNMVRALAEVRDNAEFYALMQAERAKKPDLAAWLDARRMTSYTPEIVADCKPGTLGAQIHAFISQSGMEMNFMKAGLEVRNDIEYVMKRRVANHDIEHMITGFGPHQLGEEALAIMNTTSIAAYFTPKLAQYLSEANMFVSATGYYRVSLHYPALMPAQLHAMRLGITAGEAIKKPLMMVDWEDYLDWPVEDIAADLGIERGPGEEWAWSLHASVG